MIFGEEKDELEGIKIPKSLRGSSLSQECNILSVFSNTNCPYTDNSWVYACVKAIYTNISGVPIQIKDTYNDKSSTDNPYYKLLQNPNPTYSGSQLWALTLLYYELHGGAVWILLDKMGSPINSPATVPSRIEVVSHRDISPHSENAHGVVTKWSVAMYNRSYTLDSFQLLRFFEPHPNKHNDTMNPTEAGESSINVDYKLHKFNEKFFTNGARFSGILEVSADVSTTRDELEKTRKDFDRRYRGEHNSHSTPVLGGGVKFIPTSTTGKDMDFKNLAQLTREEILAVFNVPETQVGLYKNINYSNAKVADRQFWTTNLLPKMSYMASVINAKLLDHTNFEFCWDTSKVYALQLDLTEKLKYATGLFNMGYPLNWVNKAVGLGMEEITEEFGNVPVNTRVGQ